MEIARVLLIPPLSTGTSFYLRTKYNSILYNYEQIYFFRSDVIVVNDDRCIPTPIRRTTRGRRCRNYVSASPKRNRTGYCFYFIEQFSTMKPNNFGMGMALAKKIG